MKKPLKITLISIASLLVVCLLVSGAFIINLMGRYQVDDQDYDLLPADQVTPHPEDQDEDELDTSEFPSFTLPPGETVSNEKIVNILLIGSDSRGSNDRGRSDSMMIATLDKKHKKLKLTSFLRDTYVEIYGADKNGKSYGWNKLNAAYAYGGAPLLMKTIEHNFKIKLDKYVIVDFTLFQSVVGRIEGVEINLSAAEADYLNRKNKGAGSPSPIIAKEGVNTLDGFMALSFSRARKDGVGPFTYTDGNGKQVTELNDFARAARQRYVLQQIFSKLRNENIITLYQIASDCMEFTRSNMKLSEVTGYLTDILSLGVGTLSQQQIPYKGAFVNATKTGSVLYMSPENLEKNRQKIRQFIFEN